MTVKTTVRMGSPLMSITRRDTKYTLHCECSRALQFPPSAFVARIVTFRFKGFAVNDAYIVYTHNITLHAVLLKRKQKIDVRIVR